MCGSWGKGSLLRNRGARPSRKGTGAAVGSRQRRRRDVATWLLGQETDSPQLQETVMHRVSVIVHCTAIVYYNHNRNRVSLYYCFRKINHLVPITICIHPLMFRKLCRAHLGYLKIYIYQFLSFLKTCCTMFFFTEVSTINNYSVILQFCRSIK